MADASAEAHGWACAHCEAQWWGVDDRCFLCGHPGVCATDVVDVFLPPDERPARARELEGTFAEDRERAR